MANRWKALLIVVVAIALVVGWSAAGYSVDPNPIVIGADGVMGADGLGTPRPNGTNAQSMTARQAAPKRLVRMNYSYTVDPPMGPSTSYTVYRNGQAWITVHRGTWKGVSGVQVTDPSGSGDIRVLNVDQR